MINEIQQKKIDEIMDWFNFEKVHHAMKTLGWEWQGKGTPEIPTLRKTSRSLLKQVLSSKYDQVRSGGLEASYYNDCLTLRFVLQHWTSEGDDNESEGT